MIIILEWRVWIVENEHVIVECLFHLMKQVVQVQGIQT